MMLEIPEELEGMQEPVQALMDEASKLIDRARRGRRMDYERFESLAVERVATVGRGIHAACLAALDVDAPGILIDGELFRRVDTGPLGTYRRSYAQTEPSLATTPDTGTSYHRRIWIAYNDLTEESAVLAGDPDFHNLEAISWSTDLGSSWHYKSLPYTSADPELSRGARRQPARQASRRWPRPQAARAARRTR